MYNVPRCVSPNTYPDLASLAVYASEIAMCPESTVISKKIVILVKAIAQDSK